MKHSVGEQDLHHLGNAAGPVEIGRHETAGGLQVAKHRHPRPNRFEIVQCERNLCRVSDGEQVEHGIGRAAQGHADGDPVLEGLPSQNLAREQLGLDRLDEDSA